MKTIDDIIRTDNVAADALWTIWMAGWVLLPQDLTPEIQDEVRQGYLYWERLGFTEYDIEQHINGDAPVRNLNITH